MRLPIPISVLRHLTLSAAVVFGIASAMMTASAQVAQSSTGAGQSLWVGGEYSNLRAGFPYESSYRLGGIGAYADFNWNYHISVQGEASWLRFQGFEGETESDYLAGPRYTFLHSPQWRPYAAIEAGAVRIHYPFELGSGSFFTLAPTGGLDYRLNARWSVRAQYQYQYLFHSPDFTDEPHFGIRPSGVQLGIGYRLHGWSTPMTTKR
ncbi:outer membrane beta-barrel protein [Silvibacterium sp.]|uniref:outer membrane beta-barrel protein n=1 Tax=Silvibacterium sp. TaxID=1964179 RepID=UPI0039E4E00A